MGFDVRRFLTNSGSLGTTWMRDQLKGDKKDDEAEALIEANTALAQQMFDRDYGTSQWENVQFDPRLRSAQDNALSRMEGLSREGFTDLDRQALDQGFMQSRREEQAQRGAAMDAAARRGDTSGGNALLASLSAGQGGANRASQYATDVGLAGRDRALSALESYGQQAGQMQAQNTALEGARAGGLDSFNQWATGQRSADAALLMNARGGQIQAIQQQAADLQSSAAFDIALQGAAAYVGAGGLNLGGGGGGAGSPGTTTGFSAAGNGSLSTGGTIDPVTGLAKNMPQPGGQGPQQKGMPATQRQTPNFGNMATQAAYGNGPIQARRQRRAS